MGKQLTRTVARAIEQAPCSIRELAREAGVSHVTLLRIKNGTHPASPQVARAVADALDRWGQRCSQQADRINRKLKGGGS
jgi:transcriptional regulator with XRE-family HTH domain